MKIKPMSGPSFKSGERIPSSGLYEVRHEGHNLPSQVMLVKGHTFPPCSECAIPVHFEQLKRMPHVDRLGGNVVLRVLAVLKDAV